MNCQSFAEIVSELVRNRPTDQTIDADLREHALAHTEECETCALRLQDERALTACLDEMAREMKSVTAPPRVEERLLQTFRQRSEVGSQRSEIRDQRSEIWGRRNRRNLGLLAAAAVVLIVLGIAALRFFASRNSPAGAGRLEYAAAPTPKGPPDTVAVGPASSTPKPEKELAVDSIKRINPHRRARPFNRDGNTSSQVAATTTTANVNDTESEVVTRFMPLGYAGPINLQDGGQLVRVELPRSAMLSMGLPVNMDRYSERVKADVFVGADGFARAIRFVQ